MDATPDVGPSEAEVSHAVSFIEIGVADSAKSRSFLEQMFGWKFHPFGQGSDGWFQTPSMKAGIHGDVASQGFLVFFGVPDVEAAIADVVRLGGTAEAPMEEPGFGRFCICCDPQGLRFGLHRE